MRSPNRLALRAGTVAPLRTDEAGFAVKTAPQSAIQRALNPRTVHLPQPRHQRHPNRRYHHLNRRRLRPKQHREHPSRRRRRNNPRQPRSHRHLQRPRRRSAQTATRLHQARSTAYRRQRFRTPIRQRLEPYNVHRHWPRPALRKDPLGCPRQRSMPTLHPATDRFVYPPSPLNHLAIPHCSRSVPQARCQISRRPLTRRPNPLSGNQPSRRRPMRLPQARLSPYPTLPALRGRIHRRSM